MDDFIRLPDMIKIDKRWMIVLLIIQLTSLMGCYAQPSYDKFCESIARCDPSRTEFLIQSSVDSYYKHYYHLPKDYEDLIQFAPDEFRKALVTICDSLLYKNRQLITFTDNPDSSALLYSGQIIFRLYSQYTCEDMLTGLIAMDIGMIDTVGRSCYDDSIAHIINKIVLPTVYNQMKKKKCKKHYVSVGSSKIVCRVPYLYDVQNKTLSLVGDCKGCNIKTCYDFDRKLEDELGKYDFKGIKLISFPVILYLEEDNNIR